MSAWDNSVCQTCLSDNRVLYPMCRLKRILGELDFLQLQNQEGGICWECRCLITKIYRFKIQALHAQNILCNHLESKYLGRLSQKTKNDFDYEFSHNEDPLTYEECPVKIEFTVKEEDSHVGDEDSDLQQNLEDVKVDIVRLDEKVVVNELTDKDNNANTNDSTTKAKILKSVKIKTVEHDTRRRCGGDKVRVRSTKQKMVLRKHKQKTTPTKPEDETLMADTPKPNDKQEESDNKRVTVIPITEEELREKREKKWQHYSFKVIPYKCEPCILGFRTREKYEIHVQKVHDEKNGAHICPICTARFPKSSKMEAHQQKHFSINRCTACEYESMTYHAVIKHYDDKHADRMGYVTDPNTSPVDKMYACKLPVLTCDQCGLLFRTRKTLRDHKSRIHGPNRQFVCDVCRKTFKSKARLEAHVSKHNTALARRMRYCALCDVTYKSIYIYRRHFKLSARHADRLYKCKECNKDFFSKAYYKSHYEFFHLNKSKFKCLDCDKLFITRSRLVNHQQVHHGFSRPRNYICDECNKKFFTKGMLRSHLLTHSTQRSYMCEECGDTFKQSAPLYVHTRLMHRRTKIKT